MLAGDHPVLAALRGQRSLVTVTGRELTGVGFFTTLRVPLAVPCALLGRLVIGDIDAKMRGLQYGAGFVLFVENGVLKTLEGFSYEEPWPDVIAELALAYRDPARQELLAELSRVSI